MNILVIDDKRYFPENYLDTYSYARTYDDGIKALKNGKWDMLFLDHDLGCFKDGREYTGYDIACWLEENPEYLPNEVICISSNPVGKNRIMQAIKNAQKRK